MITGIVIFILACLVVVIPSHVGRRNAQSIPKCKRYVPRVVEQNVAQNRNPCPAKAITCACCGSTQWVEEYSEAVLCSACDKAGCDLGMQ